MKNSGELNAATQLISDVKTEDEYFRNLTLKLHKQGDEKWWEVLEECTDDTYVNVLSHLPHADCASSSVLYTFSDKLFPSTLSWLTAGG